MTEQRGKKISIFDNGPIERLSWGKFTIEGIEHYLTSDGRTVGSGKDIRIIGRKVSPWFERKGHNLKKQMITGIFKQQIDILIIGNGIKGDLKVPGEVINEIHSKGIKEVIIKKTPEACQLYNNFFQEGKMVALLAHGTC